MTTNASARLPMHLKNNAGPNMHVQSSHCEPQVSDRFNGALQGATSRLDAHLLIQLINQPVLIIGRTASHSAVWASPPVICADTLVAAFVEEAVEGRQARGAG
jgi:hypothetical protein